MKLSILIPTLPERAQSLKRLMNILQPQVERYPGEVEIKIHDAGRSMTTGRKRNELIGLATGEYFVQIDDDDIVPMYYVNELMNAIAYSPDVVTFIGYMTTNGCNRENFVIKLGENYEKRNGVYYRFPNHLCCYKRSVVERVKFQNITQTEDYQWALEVKRQKLLKTEVHIEKDMYYYLFRSRK
jgi:hypothetical protein